MCLCVKSINKKWRLLELWHPHLSVRECPRTDQPTEVVKLHFGNNLYQICASKICEFRGIRIGPLAPPTTQI